MEWNGMEWNGMEWNGMASEARRGMASKNNNVRHQNTVWHGM
jgi:hypothetical protein